MICSGFPQIRLTCPDGRVVSLPREVYLSAAMKRAYTMRGYAMQLTSLGFLAVSSWVTAIKDDSTPERRGLAAEDDLRDIDRAGLVIAFTERPQGYWTGGRHVELGYAFALRKRVVVIGPSENVFHDHPAAIRFATFGAFLAALEVS